MTDVVNNSNSKSEIVNAAMFIEALKSSGYRSTYNAIAEIVDNSIDAKAKDILIIGEQKVLNGEKKIVSFAFLDNGSGMDYMNLASCLTIGYTTNQERKGMGRFGVGLPQSSVFVCDRVDVYSWQNGVMNSMCVHLDVEEVKNNNLNIIHNPEYASIPQKYEKYINYVIPDKTFNFSDHGTLVVWSKCTNVDHKKWNTCVNHMSEDLGRKYRYYLANGDVTISMCEITGSKFEKVFPNDPLYLMTPSQECVPKDLDKFISNGYISKQYDVASGYTESMFELYKPNPDSTGKVIKEIVYEEKDEQKKGTVEITYSVVKHDLYSKATLKTEQKPGGLPYGKSSKLQGNTGISIVRNGREIDFGEFGFYDKYNVPEYRWWGIEISFTSELDYAFGISNNKQSVNLKPLSKQELSEIDKNDSVWAQLYSEIKDTIKSMKDRNKAIRGEEVAPDDPTPDATSDITKEVDDDINDQLGIEDESPVMTQEEKEKEAQEQLVIEGNEKPTSGQIQKFIDSNVRVIVVHNKGKRDSFVDTSFAAGTLSIILNANNEFYKTLVEDIMDEEDKRIPFELFLVSVMKSIKTLNTTYSDAMDSLMYEINLRIQKYITAYGKQNG